LGKDNDMSARSSERQRAGLRVLVCGGRDYTDRKRLYQVLDQVHTKRGIALLIHGAARGADSLAGDWARERGIDVAPYPADWGAFERAAGPKRNQQMLDEGKPQGVVAFPTPKSVGTYDMIRRARKAGLGVMVVEPDPVR